MRVLTGHNFLQGGHILAGHGLSGGRALTLDDLPQSGLIADWRFEEGSGTTVADQTGTYDIDLTAAASPQNYTWESYGISTSDGAIQTPSLTNARTIVFLHRTQKDDTGFIMSGPVATNNGPIADSSPSTENYHIGQGFGVIPRASLPTGSKYHHLNAGGWRVMFRELAADTTGYLTLFGRGATTTNRCISGGVAACAVYNRVLTSKERDDIYAVMRDVAVSRSIYIDARDCPTRADWIYIGGQSNADGRALITGLSTPDQSRTYTKTNIQQNALTGSNDAYSALVLGSNHNDQSSSYFGPEIPIANLFEDNRTGDLYIFKSAQGGTYLAPTSLGFSAIAWSTDQPVSAAGFWNTVIRQYYRGLGDLLMSGVGINPKAFIWYQGEQDALQSATADVYETQLDQYISSLDTYIGTQIKTYICRIRDSTPSDAAAYATVRAAQAAVVTAQGARATLVDVDSYSFGDSVHLDATGMQSLGAYLYGQIWP